MTVTFPFLTSCGPPGTSEGTLDPLAKKSMRLASILRGFFTHEKTNPTPFGWRRHHELPDRLEYHLELLVVGADLALQV